MGRARPYQLPHRNHPSCRTSLPRHEATRLVGLLRRATEQPGDADRFAPQVCRRLSTVQPGSSRFTCMARAASRTLRLRRRIEMIRRACLLLPLAFFYYWTTIPQGMHRHWGVTSAADLRLVDVDERPVTSGIANLHNRVASIPLLGRFYFSEGIPGSVTILVDTYYGISVRQGAANVPINISADNSAQAVLYAYKVPAAADAPQRTCRTDIVRMNRIPVGSALELLLL
ncbi:hypothetical protein CH63R_03016 [Colletotrichum higginsianum IMI 349063]|uniref:Uncharacterized protein n=1 Tax=Colletotrichum higginsianum (strain IMI 349063) TaxID=759273 RepID=A0A1B7YQH0_COLHI|nr:hypothetical protein CH63R_03016 [Colletotrichum higginsianum IMI 349063]OBR14290.1 hypothetical protein CH63R_03016 [Colletotrichum higginsianum IMI 349063]